MRAKGKCPGLQEQSQGHKDKITAISLAETGGKVNGKLEPIEAQEKSAAGEEETSLRHYWSKKQTDTPKDQKIRRKRRLTSS